MYGQCVGLGMLSGYDGDSSHSGSSISGVNSKSKKKRVPLLGKVRRTSQPVPILPLLTALKDMAKDEGGNNGNADYDSDMSLMSLPSDLSHDGDDGARPKKNSFLHYSDEKNMDSGSQLYSDTGLQLNFEMTDSSTIMQETQVSNQLQHFSYDQVWSEKHADVFPESQAVDQISEAYKTNKNVNTPDKSCLSFVKKVYTHSEYSSAGSLSSNPQKENIGNSYDSGNSLDTLMGQNIKTVELFQEEVHGCVNKRDKAFLSSQNRDLAHNEYPRANCSSTNPQQEMIVNVYDSCNNVDIFLGKKAKTMEPFHEEVHKSSALCVKKEEDKFHTRPPLMCSSVQANRGIVLQNIINHKDILRSKTKLVDVRGIPKIIPGSDENTKQIDTKDVSNKENEIDVFASKIAAFNITPAENKPSVNKFSAFGSNPLYLSKERGFQMSAGKGITVENQLDDKVESYTPFCNINMMEHTPSLDNILHVKRKIQEDDNISELKSVGVNTSTEKDVKSPTRKGITPQNQILEPLADRYASLSKLNARENATLLDDAIPVKQTHQMGKVCCQSGFLNKPGSKTVLEYLAESKKEPSKIFTQENNSVENSVALHESPKMRQPSQSNRNFELVYKQALISAQRQDNYITVNGKSYRVQKFLGKGGSSRVLEVLDPDTKQELAMKCVNMSLAEPSVAQGYLNEIALLRRLQGSETVICMTDYEYAKEKRMLYVVMEKGEIDLSMLIKKISKTNQIPVITIIYYWVEMLRAVKNIHANGIIHSDLKPANFLLVGGRMKLIDFGIASSVQSDMTSVFKDAQAGTFNYMSPEAIQATHSTSGNQPGFKISYKSDIWSLGCILYNLLYGKTPFQHIVQPWAKVAAITNPSLIVTYPKMRSDCPPVLLKAVQLCLTYEPKKRPTAVELLELPYVNYDII